MTNMTSPIKNASKQAPTGASSASQSLEVLFDFNPIVDGIATSLPPGVKPALTLLDNKVVVTYRVRVMVQGKRLDLGTFYTQEGAVTAQMQARATKHGMQVRTSKEQEARQQLASLSADKIGLATLRKTVEVTGAVQSSVVASKQLGTPQLDGDASGSVSSGASNSASAMSMQQLDDLILETETPGYLFTGESTLEIVDPTSGATHLITPEMQVAYNEWSLQQFTAQQEPQGVSPTGANDGQASEDGQEDVQVNEQPADKDNSEENNH